MLKQTALYTRHVALGARMVDFAGWSMPIQYSGPLAEHRAVRESVGVFDVGHMGNVLLSGAGAASALDELAAWPLASLKPGRAKYTVLLNDNGGTVDDLIVYRRDEQNFFVIWNASNHAQNMAWCADTFARHGVAVEDRTESTGLIAVQGPDWERVYRKALGDLPVPEKRFEFIESGSGNDLILVARTGYTGEDGVEIWLANDRSLEVWDRLLAAGATPCGLAARDALRIEAGLPLYGHELSPDLDPFQAGVGFTVKFDARAFRGRSGLEARLAQQPRQGVVGVILEARGVPREGYPVRDRDGHEIGHITSGTFSPIVNSGVALALLNNPDSRYDEPGNRGFVVIRDKPVAARFVRPPIHTKQN